MPRFARSDIELYYEDSASGPQGTPRRTRERDAFPILLFAPGGMRSASGFWQRAPWDPVAELASEFRVIAMDQRNAGESRAPITAADGWHTYTADHLALLDHLGIERCHVIGGCIGGSYGLALVRAAPGRVAAAVLQQPIGFDGTNRDAFVQMFDGWARDIAPSHPGVTEADFAAFRDRMYGGDFVFSVDRDFVRACPVPLLVLMGNDVYHPEVTSREVASLAPRAELVEQWKTPDVVADAVKRVREFLRRHTPAR
jgi:pimeloyl-ACP methyl ester carboxylesterase